jgi:hypothetical protein
MADVTRAEFDDLAARVTTLEGQLTGATGATGATGPTAPIDPGPTGSTGPVEPEPSPDYVLLAPTVEVDGSTYTVAGSITANKAATFVYLQLAVRGPGAKDLALSPKTRLRKGASKQLSGTATGGGDYTAWVAYSLDGKSWVDGPKTSFRVSEPAALVPEDEVEPGTATGPVAPVGDRIVPIVGRSGLGFNSLVFRQSAADAEKFGSRRGVAMDGLLYFKPRQNWNDFRYTPAGQREWLEQGQIVVTSMPHAPESEGDQMNQRGANDAYRNQQRELGKWMADNGYNHPRHVVRVDWECNGNWYKWSANRPGGPDALREAIKNYVVNLRAGGATQVVFDLCFNKGPSQAGADFAIFPGAEYVQIIGMDQYDMWSPSYTAADWEREMAKGPSVRIAAEFARKNGIMWSWDEGGNTHGGKNQGGDNPKYWQWVRNEIERNADNMAWHVTYDDPGAPASLMHDFARNPKSWAKYQELFKRA